MGSSSFQTWPEADQKEPGPRGAEGPPPSRPRRDQTRKGPGLGEAKTRREPAMKRRPFADDPEAGRLPQAAESMGTDSSMRRSSRRSMRRSGRGQVAAAGIPWIFRFHASLVMPEYYPA
jgi:hypothetical protein